MSVFQSDELENRLQELEGLLQNPNLDAISVESLKQEQSAIVKLLESSRDSDRALDNLYRADILNAEQMQMVKEVEENEVTLSGRSEAVMEDLKECSSAQIAAVQMLDEFYKNLDSQTDKDNLSAFSQEARNVYDPDYIGTILKQYAFAHPVKYFVSSMIDALHKTVAEISTAKRDVYEAVHDYESAKACGYDAVSMAKDEATPGLSAALFHATGETMFSCVNTQLRRVKSVFANFSVTKESILSQTKKTINLMKTGLVAAANKAVNQEKLVSIQRQALTRVAYLYNRVSNFHANALSVKASAISSLERMASERIHQYQKIQKNLENSAQKLSDVIQELMSVPLPTAAEYASSEQGEIFASQIEAIEKVLPEGAMKKQMLADIDKQITRDKKAFDRTEARAVDAEAKAVVRELKGAYRDLDAIPGLQKKAQKRVDALSAVVTYLDAKHDKTMEQMEKASARTWHVVSNAADAFQNQGDHLEATREDLALE